MDQFIEQQIVPEITTLIKKIFTSDFSASLAKTLDVKKTDVDKAILEFVGGETTQKTVGLATKKATSEKKPVSTNTDLSSKISEYKAKMAKSKIKEGYQNLETGRALKKTDANLKKYDFVDDLKVAVPKGEGVTIFPLLNNKKESVIKKKEAVSKKTQESEDSESEEDSPPPKKTSTQKKPVPKKELSSDSEDDSPPPKKTSTQKKSTPKKEESSDSEDEDSPPPKKSLIASKKTAPKNSAKESEDSEDEDCPPPKKSLIASKKTAPKNSAKESEDSEDEDSPPPKKSLIASKKPPVEKKKEESKAGPKLKMINGMLVDTIYNYVWDSEYSEGGKIIGSWDEEEENVEELSKDDIIVINKNKWTYDVQENSADTDEDEDVTSKVQGKIKSMLSKNTDEDSDFSD